MIKRASPQLTSTSAVIDLYCRISRDYDGTTRSVDSQEADGRYALAEEPGWTLGMVHKDHALSAWNPKVVRKQWEALMARLESGEAHGVWVYDLSRFTRKPLEGERLIALADRGVIVVSAENTYNLRDADSKAHFRNDMTAAARESDKISQRTKRGKRKRAIGGRSNAAWRPYALPGYAAKPAGWRPGDPREQAPAEQVAAERDVVREAARRMLAGETLKAISRDFNARGIPTPSGGEWYFHELQSLVKRPSMAGQITYKGEQVGELPGEPVLDAQTWAALQALLASRRRGPAPNRYLLSAGMMRCGWCGAKLAGRPRPQMKPYEDGEVNREYWCAYRKDGTGCGKSLMDQRYADDKVKMSVLKRLGDPKHAAQWARKAAKATVERGRILAEIATADETGRAMSTKLGGGTMRQDRYDAFMTGLDDRLDRLRADLAAIDGPDALGTPPAEDVAATWDAAEEAGNLAARRAMVRKAFPRLTIRPPTRRGKAGLTTDRFDWTGESLPERAANSSEVVRRNT